MERVTGLSICTISKILKDSNVKTDRRDKYK